MAHIETSRTELFLSLQSERCGFARRNDLLPSIDGKCNQTVLGVWKSFMPRTLGYCKRFFECVVDESVRNFS